ncbi:MAG: T9SS type A sorting domain-containing protein [Cytophagales bacterium]
MKKILFSWLTIHIVLLAYNANADVTVSLSSGFSSQNINIMLGEKITFNVSNGHFVQSTDNPSAFTNSNGGSSSAHTFMFTPTATGTFAIRCGIHISTMLATINVAAAVPQAPTITTGLISNLSLCGGNLLSVPFSSTGIVAGFSVQLSNSNGLFTAPTTLHTVTIDGNNITVSITSDITASTSYKIRVVATTPATVGVDNLQNISINFVPTPDYTIDIFPQGAICGGNSVTFSAVTTNIMNPSFSWKFNNSIVGTGNRFINSNLANNDLGIAIVTGSTLGCNPASYAITTTSFVATVLSSVTPSISISSFPSAICLGAAVAVNGNPSGGGTSPIYTLYVDNNSIIGGNVAGTNLTGLAIGNHTIYATLETLLSCATVQSVTSNVLTVTANALPEVPTITEESINCVTTPCGSNTIVSSASVGNQWLNTFTGIVAGANQQNFSPTVSGIYKVLTTQNGCTSTSLGFNFVLESKTSVTGILDFENARKFSIYPNPATDNLIIATEQGVRKSELQIRIYDLNQKLVLEQAFYDGICKGGKGKDCLCPGLGEVNVMNLKEGMYVINLIEGKALVYSSKFIRK